MDTMDLLMLHNVRGLGERSLLNVIRAVSDGTASSTPDPREWFRRRWITKIAADMLEDPVQVDLAKAKAYRSMERAQKLGVQIMTIAEPTYPQVLRLIPDPPPLLWVKGQLPQPMKSVAIIGTRKPTKFGEKAAWLTAEYMAANGWTITSGLALGLDTVAHSSALAKGGVTVAVLANGLDSVYPRQNTELADRILGNGGCLISERDFGESASAHNLVRRDRIQSGLSIGTIVCETAVDGGSMHTARFTKEQKRLVFCPDPKPPYDLTPQSRGLHQLLTDGAVRFDGHSLSLLTERCESLWKTLTAQTSSPSSLAQCGRVADRSRSNQLSLDIALEDTGETDVHAETETEPSTGMPSVQKTWNAGTAVLEVRVQAGRLETETATPVKAATAGQLLTYVVDEASGDLVIRIDTNVLARKQP